MTKLVGNITLVIALVSAVLALLPQFGVDITKGQTDAILGVIAAAGAVLAIYFHPSIPVPGVSKPKAV